MKKLLLIFFFLPIIGFGQKIQPFGLETVGKYPFKINLFDGEFGDRVYNLVGCKYEIIKKCIVETPVKKSYNNRYIYVYGCKAHSCPSTNYDIILDIDSNILYVKVRDEFQDAYFSETTGFPFKALETFIQ